MAFRLVDDFDEQPPAQPAKPEKPKFRLVDDFEDPSQPSPSGQTDQDVIGEGEAFLRGGGSILASQGDTLAKLPGGAATLADTVASLIRGEESTALQDLYWKTAQPAIETTERAEEYYAPKEGEEYARREIMGMDVPTGEIAAGTGTIAAALPSILGMGGPKAPDTYGKIATAVHNMGRGVAGMTPIAEPMAGQRYEELTDAGVDDEAAREAMLVNQLGLHAMGAVPASVPGRLTKRAASGAAINVPLGAGIRKGESEVLGEDYAEQAQPTWDADAIAVDAILGAVFGTAFGGRPGPRVRPQPDTPSEATPVPDTYTDPFTGELKQGDIANDPEFLANLNEYKAAMEANNISDPEDPRARQLVEMIMRRKQREAERYPGRTETEGEDLRQDIDTGEVHPRAAEHAGRQAQEPADVMYGQAPPRADTATRPAIDPRDRGAEAGYERYRVRPEQVEQIERYLNIPRDEVAGYSEQVQTRLARAAEEAAAREQQRAAAGPYAAEGIGRDAGAPEGMADPASRPNVPGDREPFIRSEYEDITARRQPTDAEVEGMEATPQARQAARKRSGMIDRLQKDREQLEALERSEPYQELKARYDTGNLRDKIAQEAWQKISQQRARLQNRIQKTESQIYDLEAQSELGTRGGSGRGDRPFRSQDTSGLDEQQGEFFRQRAEDMSQEQFDSAMADLEARWRRRERLREKDRAERESYQREQSRAEDKYRNSRFTEEGFLQEDGTYRTDEFGFVLDEGNAPIKFADHKAAARWILTKGNRNAPRQTFELHNHPSGDGLTIQVTMTKPPSDPPPRYEGPPGRELPGPDTGGRGPRGGEPPRQPEPDTEAWRQEVSDDFARASDESGEASVRFDEVRQKYRRGEITDEEFIAAREEHEAALRRFDEAEAREQGREAPPRKEAPARKTREQAAKENARRRDIIREGDPLTVAIAKAGGISPEAAREMNLEGRAMRVPPGMGYKGVRWLVHKNGMEWDAMRERMVEEGYFKDGENYNRLMDMLDDELSSGRPQHFGRGTPDESVIEQMYADRYASEAEAMADENFDIGVEREVEFTPDEIDAIMQEFSNDENFQSGPRAAGRAEEADEGAAGPDTASRTPEEGGDTAAQRSEGTPGREGGEREPEFDLESYTERDIQQRENAREEAARAEDARQREADARQRADRERDEFELRGSDRPADANPRQVDPFATGGKVYSNPLDPELIRRAFGEPVRKILGREAEEMRTEFESLKEWYNTPKPVNHKKAVHVTGDIGRVVGYTNSGMLRALFRRYPEINELRELHDTLDTEPGSGRKINEPFEAAADRNGMSYMNRLSNILGRRPNRALEKEIGDILAGRKRGSKSTEAGEKADRIRNLLNQFNKYAKEAGVDIGFIRNYFPRIPNADAVMANMDGARRAAERVYRKVGLDSQTAKEAAEEWIERVLGIRHGRTGTTTMQSKFTKGRRWPPEADKIMEEFLISDPREVLTTYFRQVSRKAEFTRRFGENGEKVDEWIEQMARKGMTAQDIGIVRQAFDSSVGLMQATKASDFGGFASWVQTIGTIRLLPRAVIPSMGEAFTVGVQTQSPRLGLKAFVDSYKFLFAGGKADRVDVRRGVEMMGIIGDAMTQQMLAARYGGGMMSRNQQKLLSGFFRTTFLHQLTEAQRVAGVNIGAGFVKRLIDDVVDNNSRSRSSQEILNDLGIGAEDVPALQKWFGEDKGMPKVQKLMGDSREADLFRQAMARFSRQSIQGPMASQRPRYANDPIGRMAYGIMSFIYGFQKNVLQRTGKQAVKALSDPNLSLADRAQFLSSATALAVLAGVQMGISDAREALLNPETDAERDEWERWFLRISRAGLTGAFDPLLQAFMAVRYQRPLSSILTGPYLTSYFEDMQTVGNVFIRNSEKTNTAEHNAVRSMYHGVMAPGISTILSVLPGGPIVRFGYGVTMQSLASPQRARDAADAIVGPKGSKTGGGRSLSGRGGGRRSGGRELRGR